MFLSGIMDLIYVKSPSVLIRIIKQKVMATVVILRHALPFKDILSLKRGLCIRFKKKIKLKHYLFKEKMDLMKKTKLYSSHNYTKS